MPHTDHQGELDYLSSTHMIILHTPRQLVYVLLCLIYSVRTRLLALALMEMEEEVEGQDTGSGVMSGRWEVHNFCTVDLKVKSELFGY